MAEAALFSIATKLLSTLASPALEKAYERGLSIWDAKDELAKLGTTIQAVQAVFLDAEKKQERSHAVKLWIKRVRDVLYDADDLFDEVTTNNQLKQQMTKSNKCSGKVLVLCSLLNPVVSSDSIAKRVKVIRKSLDQIREDMTPFSFVQCLNEEPVYGVRGRQDEGHFADPKIVVGRDDEKKAITEFLFKDFNEEQNVSVIAVVGIGGMGKTTVARLVYNDDEVQKKFGKQRWWACISDITDEKEVLGRIFKAMTSESYQDLNVSQLQSKIVESLNSNEVVLLVLDDLWDSDYNRWLDRKSVLKGCAKGSKIIVTTRDDSVVRAIDAVKTHRLGDLTPKKSWELFKMIAFDREQENDPRWTSIGEEIVKRCAGVPLAIRSIASLLRKKTTLEEWETFRSNELSKIELSDNPVMSALKLSYDHLSSDLKQCFAYCSLFEKDSRILKRELIYLWAAQGYLQTNNESCTIEEVGHVYFMDLLRRSFFQEVCEDEVTGEIVSCKMHDLVNDLAQLMAGDESIILSTENDQFNNNIRHVSVGFEMDGSWEPSPSLLEKNRPRSFLVTNRGSRDLDQHLAKLKFLRVLGLQGLKMENVSSSIGELKHLRYLNLSGNDFKSLPNSITQLLNLLSLDISECGRLETLPKDFRKLINLRHLDTSLCYSLKYMPDGFGELTSLQHLKYFMVGNAPDGGEGSRLDALEGLQLKGFLQIKYDNDQPTDNWTEDELVTDFSMLAASLKQLSITGYPGMKVLVSAPNLVSLFLSRCFSFSSMSSFAYLKSLWLESISQLEHLKDMGATEGAGHVLFFPCLERLWLFNLPKFKGAATTADKEKEREHPRHHHAMPLFPRLSDLEILDCPELRAMPLSPCLQKLVLSGAVGAESMPTILSTSLKQLEIYNCDDIVSLPGEALTSLQTLVIYGSEKLKSVKLAPPHLDVLEKLMILDCPELMMEWDSLPNLRKLTLWSLPLLEIFMGEALTSLSFLKFWLCNKLKKVKLAPADVNALEELVIWECGDLEMWEENKRGIDWESLPNLRTLRTNNQIPNAEKLPECLQDRHALGNLVISNCRLNNYNVQIYPKKRINLFLTDLVMRLNGKGYLC